MARIAFQATLGQSLGQGRYNTTSAGLAPLLTAATTADDAVATAQALEAAITSAQSAAEANGTISGNGTALALVQAIGTATALYVAAVVAAKTATAAAKTGADGPDVILDIDAAVVTNQNAVQHALRELTRTISGSGMSTA